MRFADCASAAPARRRRPARAPEAAPPDARTDHEFPLARIPLAAAGAAAAGAAVRVAPAAQEEAGAALRQPVDRASEAMGAGQTVRRHMPPVLFLLALAALLLAAARPMAVVTLPSNQQTIILAMDVSGSMRAADVQPNRLVAAQNAAKSFLDGPAARREGGHRRLRRHGPGGAAAHREPRRPGHRDRPLPAAARHRHRQRHRDLAGHAVPRCRHRASSRLQTGRERQRGVADRAGRARSRRRSSRRSRRAPTPRPRSSC